MLRQSYSGCKGEKYDFTQALLVTFGNVIKTVTLAVNWLEICHSKCFPVLESSTDHVALYLHSVAVWSESGVTSVFTVIRRGIRSSCYSEGSSWGWASAPGWSPGPSDPEPACGAGAPARSNNGNKEDVPTDENKFKRKLLNVNGVCLPTCAHTNPNVKEGSR